MTERRPGVIRAWVMAARPRTLFAAAAPVALGTACAFSLGKGHFPTACATLFSALALQITANLANDYWDFKKGADSPGRLGPTRVTAAGLLSPLTVLAGTLVSLAVGCMAGLVLVARAGWPILLLGFICAALALLYTAGPFPLAYRGLGDVFAFLFFGPVAVAGTFWVQALEFTWSVLLVGTIPGCYALALIATNNLRDFATDRLAGKRTLVVRFGPTFGTVEIVAAVFAPAAVIAELAALGLLGNPAAITAAILALAFGLVVAQKVCRGPGGAALNSLFPIIGLASLVQAVVLSIGILLPP